MFSTIQEAWGDDFLEQKPIFRQSNTPEHFKAAPASAHTLDACPCCRRPYDTQYAKKTIEPMTVSLAKVENRELVSAVLVGLLVILLLHMFNPASK
jgi:hypothetical protein